jgi:predicted nucleotidyltransferase
MGREEAPISGIADVLFPRVRQRVLGFLFGQPDRSYRGAELIRMAGSGTGAVHRELTRLAASGLVLVTRVGNQKHYRANRESPVFSELQGLIAKTVGLIEPLREALTPVADHVHSAFVYGSVAKGADTADSDIDLMVLADEVGYADLYPALQRVEEVLHRPVNPNIMSLKEWREKRAAGNPFVLKVVQQPKLFVFGADDDLAWTGEPASDRIAEGRACRTSGVRRVGPVWTDPTGGLEESGAGAGEPV